MLYFFVFVFGLIFGSFISAISWRIPRNVSFVKGRSMCPKCASQIAWFDNIPVLSFLILGGKCRHCKNSISFRYPVIELATALGFVAIFHNFIMSKIGIFALIIYLLMFILLLTIFVIDLEHQIIPDPLTFIGIAVYFLYLLFSNQPAILASLFSGLIGATFLLTIYLVTKGRGMGLGDVKFAILGGLIVGINLLPLWLLLSFIIGAISGIILIFVGKAKMQTKIAFGPFLVLSIAIVLFLGNYIAGIFNLI